MKKDSTLTMRISVETSEALEKFAEQLTKERGIGAKRVSKSEAASILLELGQIKLMENKKAA